MINKNITRISLLTLVLFSSAIFAAKSYTGDYTYASANAEPNKTQCARDYLGSISEANFSSSEFSRHQNSCTPKVTNEPPTNNGNQNNNQNL